MSWDGFQRAVLAELGHVPWRLAGAAPAVVDAGPAAADAGPIAPPPAAQPDAAMLARLARAAALAPHALQDHPAIVAACAGLRGDAAAKRALWPHLRRLRRGGRR